MVFLPPIDTLYATFSETRVPTSNKYVAEQEENIVIGNR